MDFTRREFLKSSTALSTSLAVPSVWMSALQAKALEACEQGRNLVVVQLDGGNDGTNTVVPFTGGYRSTYETLRPILGISQSELAATSLGPDPGDPGATLAFHPHMRHFKRLHDDGNLATLIATHYENFDLSHFDSERVWYGAPPEGSHESVPVGWLGGSIAELCAGQPFALPAIDVRSSRNLMFNGAASHVLATSSLRSLRFPTHDRLSDEERAEFRAIWETIQNDAAATGSAFEQLIAGSLIAGVERIEPLKQVDESLALNLNDLEEGTQNGSGGFGVPGDSFASQLSRGLKLVFGILMGGPPGTPIGPRIFRVSHGNFDRHEEAGVHQPLSQKSLEQKQIDNFQRPNFPRERHGELLYELDQAVAAFWQDCVEAGIEDRTSVFVFSEFSRRVEDNRDDVEAGNDHGTLGHVFYLGPRANQVASGQPYVNGGAYGTHPDMNALDDGGNYPWDPVNSTDYRDVYNEIMTRWLDLDAGAAQNVLSGYAADPLGFIA